MQQLKILPTANEMVVKISLKGISHIQDRQFKKRHYGAKKVFETADGTFREQAAYKQLFPNEFVKQKPKKKSNTEEATSDNIVKKHAYKIDKSAVKSRLQTFYQCMNGEKLLYFWTVTFPQDTTEQEGHRLFNIWLTRCRKELNLKSYLWIKEKQQNGTIHFHIAVNQRMDVKRANRYMRASIMTAIDNGSIKWSRIQATKYNGVDIAKDRKTRRVVNFAQQKKHRALSNYLTKYVTKNQTEFELLAWHCSRDYSQLIIAFALTKPELLKWQIFKAVDREHPFVTEWIAFFFWQKKPPKTVLQYLIAINQKLRTDITKN